MKISTILDHIDSGHMALPEFQRGYVWNSDQVRKLLTSLYLRRPVGGLLVWATESITAAHRGDGPPPHSAPRPGDDREGSGSHPRFLPPTPGSR